MYKKSVSLYLVTISLGRDPKASGVSTGSWRKDGCEHEQATRDHFAKVSWARNPEVVKIHVALTYKKMIRSGPNCAHRDICAVTPGAQVWRNWASKFNIGTNFNPINSLQNVPWTHQAHNSTHWPQQMHKNPLKLVFLLFLTAKMLPQCLSLMTFITLFYSCTSETLCTTNIHCVFFHVYHWCMCSV